MCSLPASPTFYTKSSTTSSLERRGVPSAYATLLLICDLGFGPEFLVVAIADGQPDSLWAGSEVQRIVSIGGHREPEITVYLFPQRREMREKILVLRRLDLRHRYAFAADDRVICF